MRFQPYWALSRLDSARFQKHHRSIPILVMLLPPSGEFTIHDLLDGAWSDQGLNPKTASIILQIINRVGLLESKGSTKEHIKRWFVNRNFREFVTYIEKLGGTHGV